MSDQLIVHHCAPTLAGLKAGSLFSCPCRDAGQLTGELRRLNRALAPKGLRVLPLQTEKGRALIYLYRPWALERELAGGEARALLKERGYGAEAACRYLARLARKLRAGEAFPHEIGLFLSYPPRDVRGFICNGACRHKCAGCWKVYGNEAAALRTFEVWRRCTRILEARLAQGCPLEKLAVAG